MARAPTGLAVSLLIFFRIIYQALEASKQMLVASIITALSFNSRGRPFQITSYLERSTGCQRVIQAGNRNVLNAAQQFVVNETIVGM